jgi:hypothetical protein
VKSTNYEQVTQSQMEPYSVSSSWNLCCHSLPLSASSSAIAATPPSKFWLDRIHDSLEKDTPNLRPVEPKPAANATVISNDRLGGLHHRYGWREAA